MLDDRSCGSCYHRRTVQSNADREPRVRVRPWAGRAGARGPARRTPVPGTALALVAWLVGGLAAQDSAPPADRLALRAEQRDARRVLADAPDDAAAWARLARASLALEQSEMALEALEQAVAIGLPDPDPYFALGTLYASGGRLAAALEAFREGLRRDPDSRPGRFNYARVLLASGDAPEAARQLEGLARDAPSDGGVALALVEARLMAGRREAALAAAAELAGEAPDAAELIQLGRILVRESEVDLAARVLGRAAERADGDAALWVEISRLRQERGDPEGAIAAAERATRMEPDRLEAALAHAEALVSFRRHREALAFLLERRSRFADRAEFRYTLGVAYFGLHRYLEAAAELGRAAELDPSWDTAHFLLGTSRLASGDAHGAAEAYRGAIAANPGNPLHFVYLMRAHDQTGPEGAIRAVAAAERALALDPGNIECRTRLARNAFERGRLGEARMALEGIVGAHPDLPRPRILLARTYSRLGLAGEARVQRDAIRALELEQQARDAARGRSGATDGVPSPGLGLGAQEGP